MLATTKGSWNSLSPSELLDSQQNYTTEGTKAVASPWIKIYAVDAFTSANQYL